LDVLATPRLAGGNRGLAARGEALVKFFANLLGDAPYPSLTITAADALLPGGHSPAYFALVQQPLPSTPFAWRDDPLNFDRFPDFLLGHEVAHQWWGQAVGFKNYHDQWLSEGLAQYSAVMFIESTRPDLLRGLLTRMRDSAAAFSAKGPIYLGYRLGHIEGRGATFRAIAYNKSAVVLHMLRRMIGDEAFRNGLRRFYREWRFRKAGTDDLRAAFEAEARRPLGPFFDRWILGSTLPRVRVTAEAGRAPGFATVHVEQIGEVFDFPLTVTVQYADGRMEEQTLLVTEAIHDHRIPLAAPVRRILTRDELTLAEWVD
jgi:aminopeptidase N